MSVDGERFDMSDDEGREVHDSSVEDLSGGERFDMSDAEECCSFSGSGSSAGIPVQTRLVPTSLE